MLEVSAPAWSMVALSHVTCLGANSTVSPVRPSPGGSPNGTVVPSLKLSVPATTWSPDPGQS